MMQTEVRPIDQQEAERLANGAPPPTPLEAECNVFATDPKGFKVHFKLIGQANKIINNLEVLTDGLLARGYVPERAPGPPQPQSDGPSGVAEWQSNADGSRSCSVHGPAKWVPPGTSKKTGKPYNGFWSCQSQGCQPKGDN